MGYVAFTRTRVHGVHGVHSVDIRRAGSSAAGWTLWARGPVGRGAEERFDLIAYDNSLDWIDFFAWSDEFDCYGVTNHTMIVRGI